jgi:hypothetical protein
MRMVHSPASTVDINECINSIDDHYFNPIGVDECTSDVYEQCALYKLSGNSSSITVGDTTEDSFAYLQCMEINEGNPSKAESCFVSTMAKTTSLDWATVSKCAATESAYVQGLAASATPSLSPHSSMHCTVYYLVLFVRT